MTEKRPERPDGDLTTWREFRRVIAGSPPGRALGWTASGATAGAVIGAAMGDPVRGVAVGAFTGLVWGFSEVFRIFGPP
jgi:hypothetical protein